MEENKQTEYELLTFDKIYKLEWFVIYQKADKQPEVVKYYSFPKVVEFLKNLKGDIIMIHIEKKLVEEGSI